MGNSYKVIAPDRFLTTREFDGCVTVKRGEATIATSRKAIFLNEGERAPVAYLPNSDISPAVLARSRSEYRCRWKGDAVFFDVECDKEPVVDGAWAYPDAPEDLLLLRDRIAFDANLFQILFAENGAGLKTAPQPETLTE